MMFFISLIALASASIADISAFTERQFAQSRFRFNRPSVVRMHVQTCNSNGKVKAIQVRVTEGILNMSALDLFYTNGGKERMGGFTLGKGQSSPWLTLANQEDPCLKQIHLNVGSTGNKMTNVQIIGQWKK